MSVTKLQTAISRKIEFIMASNSVLNIKESIKEDPEMDFDMKQRIHFAKQS